MSPVGLGGVPVVRWKHVLEYLGREWGKGIIPSVLVWSSTIRRLGQATPCAELADNRNQHCPYHDQVHKVQRCCRTELGFRNAEIPTLRAASVGIAGDSRPGRARATNQDYYDGTSATPTQFRRSSESATPHSFLTIKKKR